MSTVQRIAKNTSFLVLSSIVQKALSLVLIIYIARYLGDAGFGQFSFILAFVGLFTVLIDPGLNGYVQREVARYRAKAGSLLGSVFIIKFFLSILTITAVAVSINVLNYPWEVTRLVYLAGASMIISNFSWAFRNLYFSFEKMEYEFWTISINRLLVVALSVLALISGYGIAGLIVAHLIGSIFELLFSSFVVIRKITKPALVVDYSLWKGLLRSALPFALMGVFVSIYNNIDVVMLSKMKGDDVTGWYNAAYRLITAFMFIPYAFMGSVVPVLNRFFVSSRSSMELTYVKSFKYLFIIALPIAAGTTLLSDRIIAKIYGPEFVEAAAALKVLIWGGALMFLNPVTSSTLVSNGREKLVTALIGIGIMINVVLNLLLIPPHGHVGASLATVATEAWVFVISLYIISKQYFKLPLKDAALKPIAATIAMAIFIVSFTYLRLYLLIFIGAILYFLILVGVKGISEEDFKLIRKAIKRG